MWSELNIHFKLFNLLSVSLHNVGYSRNSSCVLNYISTIGYSLDDESGRFGALKSDSTHHFFSNACTKSGSLRFSGCWLILSVYILFLCKIAWSTVILLLPLFIINYSETLPRRTLKKSKSCINRTLNKVIM
jgi:hypothetical protein